MIKSFSSALFLSTALAVAQPALADQYLPMPHVDAGGNVSFPGGPTIGTWIGGVWTPSYGPLFTAAHMWTGAQTFGAINAVSINGAAIGTLNTAAGNILVGSGTAINSVTVTGAFTLSATGVATLNAGQAVLNLGFTPLNKAGDTMAGTLTVPAIIFPATSTGGAHLTASQNLDVFGSLNFVNNTAGTTTSDAGAFPQWRYDAGSNAQVGNKMSTTATGSTANIISIMQTGSLNSFSGFEITDGQNLQIMTGAGLTGGIIIAPAAGSTTVQSPLSVTGMLTAPSINMTANPSLHWTFGGLDTLNSLLVTVTGASTTNPQQAALFQIINSDGNSNPTGLYKTAIAGLCSAVGNASSCWGANIVAGANNITGANKIGIVGVEIDIDNSSGKDYTGTISNPYAVGLYISGAGTNINNAGIIVDGSSLLWDNGILVHTQGSVSSIRTAAFADQSLAPTSYLDTGAHINGINLAGTYSGFAITSNGFTVDSLGDVVARVLTVSSSIQVNGPLIQKSAPTISSGFGTTPRIVADNGPASFRINVGTGGAAGSGVIGLPAAANDWNCTASDVTTQNSTVFVTKQTASTSSSATLTNYSTAGTAAAWTSADVLQVSCLSY